MAVPGAILPPVTAQPQRTAILTNPKPQFQILDNLSMAAIARRLDKRRLQHELDMHRLYLLTQFHELGGLQGACGG